MNELIRQDKNWQNYNSTRINRESSRKHERMNLSPKSLNRNKNQLSQIEF